MMAAAVGGSLADVQKEGTLAAKEQSTALVVTGVDHAGELFRERLHGCKEKANQWKFQTKRLLTLDSWLLLEMFSENHQGPPMRWQAKVLAAKLDEKTDGVYSILVEVEGQTGGKPAPTAKPAGAALGGLKVSPVASYPAKQPGGPKVEDAPPPIPSIPVSPAKPAYVAPAATPVAATVSEKDVREAVDRAVAKAVAAETEQLARKVEEMVRAAAEKAVLAAATAQAQKSIKAEMSQEILLLTETALQNLRTRMSEEFTRGLSDMQAQSAEQVHQLRMLREEIELRMEGAQVEVQELGGRIERDRAQLQSLVERLETAVREANETIARLRAAAGATQMPESHTEESRSPAKPFGFTPPEKLENLPGENDAQAGVSELIERAEKQLLNEVQRTFENQTKSRTSDKQGK